MWPSWISVDRELLKEPDCIGKPVHLLLEAFGGRSALLDEGGVLLRDLVEMANRFRHLGDAVDPSWTSASRRQGTRIRGW